ncbi:hypothetical protein GCM10010372_76940 [Streptomyces tauricus]|nr:hypothetical protein GCM10010372_76940 [Streptomyces tauricus]
MAGGLSACALAAALLCNHRRILIHGEVTSSGWSMDVSGFKGQATAWVALERSSYLPEGTRSY